ncbi:MAG TPA: type II toxin-antitoxin system VapC family toxin [Verrucomicrobiae bacterium]|jgi:predicted nucleic acid-binding protein|nr:type II toxin-antitoxin system VapC family toxin [Verrucomicrobiae bacterium]
MKPYADTNLFTRLYLQLPETPVALRWIEQARRSASSSIPITWLHRMEFTNAVEQHVYAGNSGQVRVTPEQAAMALMSFRDDLSREEFLHTSIIDLHELERQFEELSLRHTAKHGFRTYDLLHVASALLFECDTFWTFDPKALKLAALEGFKIRH